MNAQRRTVVLAIPPGPLRDGVAALLAALPGVDSLEQSHDCEATLQLVAALRPAAVVVDGSLSGMGVPALVARLRTGWPATRCLVLADDVHQQHRLVGAGADAVLLKGASPARIADAFQAMLR